MTESNGKQKAITRNEKGQFASGYTPPTAWKPGQSGNLNGRRSAAKDILNDLLDAPKDEKSRREKLLDKLILMAERGNLSAIKEILDRTDGRSKEYIEQRITRDEVVIE